MTHDSLFSGIGAAELAAEWMGWQNLFHCEINPFCRRVLDYWFKDAESYEDITKTDFSRWRGQVDILTGGFPCQPFSIAGERKGESDDRYLWPQMLRAVREIQPAWVVAENVSGLLTMVQPSKAVDMGGDGAIFEENHLVREEQHYTIQTIMQGLEGCGYAVQPFVIPACAVGAPHKRDRVWIIAHARNGGGQRGGGHDVTARPPADSNSNGLERHLSRLNGQAKQSGAASVSSGDLKAGEGQDVPSYTNGQRDMPPQADRGTEGIGGHHNALAEERVNTAKQSDRLARLPRPSDNPCCNGRQEGRVHHGEPSKEQRKRESSPADSPQGRWRGFPTQSPTCRRDDGLSLGLDGISFPKWRNETIKALGNAIVPQVIYEIFRAIEQTDKSL